MITLAKRVMIFLFPLGLMAIFGDWAIKTGQKNYNSYSNYKIKALLEDKNIDTEVIIFGSSVAEGSFDPHIISQLGGFTAFNAALSGRRIPDWNSLAFSYLDYCTKTRYLILEIFPNVFNTSEQLYQPHEFFPYLNNTYVKASLAPISITYSKVCSIPFYYFTQINSVLVKNSIDGLRYSLSKRNFEIDKHYSGFNNPHVEFEVGDKNGQVEPHISTSSIEWYRKLFKRADEKGIQVLLIGMPVYEPGRKFFPASGDVYAYGDTFSKEFDNVRFINFYSDTTLIFNQNYFANYTHLSKIGARVLTEKVVLNLRNEQ